jgi:glucokinase
LSAAYPFLVADVGGTNARFAWVAAPGAAPAHVRVLPVAAHVGPELAVRAYLQELALLLGAEFSRPRSAAFALATALKGDLIELTNADWRFSRQQLQRALGLDVLLVLNDFEALALSLPRLGAEQLRLWGPALTLPKAPHTLAVIGPGTGLGVGGVMLTHHGWVALAGEGGHVSLSAADHFEGQLLDVVRRDYTHVSAERLLSGLGLPLLHVSVATVLGLQVEPLKSEQIVAAGLTGADAVCSRTLDSFCALLGSFAGNVALTLGARGGVYIGGGIVPRLGERFFVSQFRERFESKGRFRAYLEVVPTALITDTLAALSGAALALEQHGA